MRGKANAGVNRDPTRKVNASCQTILGTFLGPSREYMPLSVKSYQIFIFLLSVGRERTNQCVRNNPYKIAPADLHNGVTARAVGQ